jgi:hypothetical protein
MVSVVDFRQYEEHFNWVGHGVSQKKEENCNSSKIPGSAILFSPKLSR